jgi:hypothetical protein
MAETKPDNAASNDKERDEGTALDDELDAAEDARNRMGGFRHSHTAESAEAANETEGQGDKQDTERPHP